MNKAGNISKRAQEVVDFIIDNIDADEVQVIAYGELEDESAVTMQFNVTGRLTQDTFCGGSINCVDHIDGKTVVTVTVEK